MLFEVKHLIPGIGILVSKAFIVKEIGHDLYKVKNRKKNIRIGSQKWGRSG